MSNKPFLRVICVGLSPKLRDAIYSCFRANGHEVRLAENAQICLDLVSKTHVEFDVILVCHELPEPEFNGLTLIGRLRDDFFSKCIIAFVPGALVSNYHKGADSVVTRENITASEVRLIAERICA